MRVEDTTILDFDGELICDIGQSQIGMQLNGRDQEEFFLPGSQIYFHSIAEIKTIIGNRYVTPIYKNYVLASLSPISPKLPSNFYLNLTTYVKYIAGSIFFTTFLDNVGHMRLQTLSSTIDNQIYFDNFYETQILNNGNSTNFTPIDFSNIIPDASFVTFLGQSIGNGLSFFGYRPYYAHAAASQGLITFSIPIINNNKTIYYYVNSPDVTANLYILGFST